MNTAKLFLFLFVNNFVNTVLLLMLTKNKCPELYEGHILEFVNRAGITLLENSNTGCSQTLTCDVISAPVETTVEWLFNGRVFYKSTSENSNTDSGNKKDKILGLGETAHRLCLSDLFNINQVRPSEYWKKIYGSNIIQCRVNLACDISKIIESISLELAFKDIESAIEKHLNWRQFKPPMILLSTSSRTELAGQPLQIMCRAIGHPIPFIRWAVLEGNENGTMQHRPIESYPFIKEVPNGDLQINTSQTSLSSFSVQCRAMNIFGEDSSISTVILLD